MTDALHDETSRLLPPGGGISSYEGTNSNSDSECHAELPPASEVQNESYLAYVRDSFVLEVFLSNDIS